MAQEYYYGQMNREEQEAYRGMFAGFCDCLLYTSDAADD